MTALIPRPATEGVPARASRALDEVATGRGLGRPARSRPRPRRAARARRVGGAPQPELWRDQVAFGDGDRRHYVCLHRDAHVDVWLLCWTPTNDTGWHDHDISSGAVAVTQGALVEHNLAVGGPTVTTEIPAGRGYGFGPDHIHRLTGRRCRQRERARVLSAAVADGPVHGQPTPGCCAARPSPTPTSCVRSTTRRRRSRDRWGAGRAGRLRSGRARRRRDGPVHRLQRIGGLRPCRRARARRDRRPDHRVLRADPLLPQGLPRRRLHAPGRRGHDVVVGVRARDRARRARALRLHEHRQRRRHTGRRADLRAAEHRHDAHAGHGSGRAARHRAARTVSLSRRRRRLAGRVGRAGRPAHGDGRADRGPARPQGRGPRARRDDGDHARGRSRARQHRRR